MHQALLATAFKCAAWLGTKRALLLGLGTIVA